MHPAFLFYFLQSSFGQQQIQLNVKGSALPGLNSKFAGVVEWFVPPIVTQQRLSAHLDERTARIDELIARKQQLVTLLAEKRTALISHAVTKGFDSGAATKESGTAWFGRIPHSWSSTKPKYVTTRIVDGVHHTPDYVHDGIPFITVKNLTASAGISFDDTKFITPDDHEELCKRAKPEKGDVLITKDGTLGIPRVIETDRVFSIFVSVALLKPVHCLIDPYFLAIALESKSTAEQFASRTLGSALKHLHLEEIANITIPFPPLKDQHAIRDGLRSRLETLHSVGQTLSAAIERLKEYRSALISAAVTGKIDVREVNT